MCRWYTYIGVPYTNIDILVVYSYVCDVPAAHIIICVTHYVYISTPAAHFDTVDIQNIILKPK